MSRQKRFIALIIALVLAVGMVSAAVFALESADHECSCAYCHVCVQMRNFLKLFSGIDSKPESVLGVLGVVYLMTVCRLLKDKIIYQNTPIELKVKLSN